MLLAQQDRGVESKTAKRLVLTLAQTSLVKPMNGAKKVSVSAIVVAGWLVKIRVIYVSTAHAYQTNATD